MLQSLHNEKFMLELSIMIFIPLKIGFLESQTMMVHFLDLFHFILCNLEKLKYIC